MRPPLTVAVAQPRLASHDIAGNAGSHAAVVREAGARVVVFPELSLTGYELDASPLSPDDHRLVALVAACAESGSVALAGAPVASGVTAHIATLAITGQGVEVAYGKMWLGGDEPRHFAAGAGPAVLEVDGWRLGLGICKDIRTDAQIEATARVGIDAYVAGLVHLPEELPMQDARGAEIARRHEVPVAFASFAGRTGGGFTETAGCSTIWSPGGRVIARASADPGEWVTVTLSVARGRGAPPGVRSTR